jgi:NADPH-dependent ferric siderophore reductase
MIRVVLDASEAVTTSGFAAGEFTDHYVKLLFPRPGVTYPTPLEMAVVRETMPREDWPATRTYTVRAWHPETAELVIDFVYHGDEGLAGPWALTARPGDELLFNGPGGAYAPDQTADWHLLAGDESALPAIAASLERVPAGSRVHAFVEVAGPAEEQPLTRGTADASVRWLHRGDRPVGQAIVEAVRSLEFPAGDVHAFVHGEANFVKELRRHLRVERGVDRDRLSISGYWRLGHDEDGWQSGKRAWNQRIEDEEAGALAG